MEVVIFVAVEIRVVIYTSALWCWFIAMAMVEG